MGTSLFLSPSCVIVVVDSERWAPHASNAAYAHAPTLHLLATLTLTQPAQLLTTASARPGCPLERDKKLPTQLKCCLRVLTPYLLMTDLRTAFTYAGQHTLVVCG